MASRRDGSSEEAREASSAETSSERLKTPIGLPLSSNNLTRRLRLTDKRFLYKFRDFHRIAIENTTPEL